MMDFNILSAQELETMAEAGREVAKWEQVLAKTGDNVVGELLRTRDTFYEFEHCPPGDIYDRENHAQYYYHAHRPGEHGHFHTFLREKGIPADCQPVAQSEADYMKQRDDTYSHLVAISMNRQGFPIGLFTTNRWVTAENWYAADDVCAMLDHFEIDHAHEQQRRRDQQPEAYVVDAREGDVGRADHQRHEPVTLPREFDQNALMDELHDRMEKQEIDCRQCHEGMAGPSEGEDW